MLNSFLLAAVASWEMLPIAQERFTLTEGECGFSARYSTSLVTAGLVFGKSFTSNSVSEGSNTAVVIKPVDADGAVLILFFILSSNS